MLSAQVSGYNPQLHRRLGEYMYTTIIRPRMNQLFDRYEQLFRKAIRPQFPGYAPVISDFDHHVFQDGYNAAALKLHFE